VLEPDPVDVPGFTAVLVLADPVETPLLEEALVDVTLFVVTAVALDDALLEVVRVLDMDVDVDNAGKLNCRTMTSVNSVPSSPVSSHTITPPRPCCTTNAHFARIDSASS
jgi:hypothetical protein